MEFLIITGLSGAGKSRAADILEDLDYYCVDNMPIELMPRFAELCVATGGRYEKVALVTDVREVSGFDMLFEVISRLKTMECNCRILYMDADRRSLVRRYKESRRPHPMAKNGCTIEEAISEEIEILRPVKEEADYIIDTSSLTVGMLQNELFALFAGAEKKREIRVTVMSFGFKHGLPMDADLVFDVRFLPNPYYVDELRAMTGLDEPVRNFIFGFEQTKKFEDQLESMLEFLIPLYIEEGKVTLNIAIGCTGGRHRSVAIAAALHEALTKKGISSVNINRDVEK